MSDLTKSELKEAYDKGYKDGQEALAVHLELCKEEESIITVPGEATNGDMIKAMFNIADGDIDEGISTIYVYTKTRIVRGGSQDIDRIMFNKDWWNSPYRKELK